MALTLLEEKNINALLVSIFNSSAANFFQEIEDFFVSNGNDLSLLAVQLGTTEIFEAQFRGLSNEEQADSMLVRFGLANDNVTGSAGSIAYAFFLEEIQNGISLSDTLLATSNYLTNITLRDPIFNNTTTLLENKAIVAQELSNSGVVYSDLSAKILTVVTLDSNSVSAAKAIVDLMPTGTVTIPPAMQSTISNIVDNVKSMATSGTAGTLANVASYLEAVTLQISTATPASLASILTAINSVTTSALTSPAILDTPRTLATNTVTSPDTIETAIETTIEDLVSATFMVNESTNAVTGFGGTATGDITLTSWAASVGTSTVTFTREGVTQTTTTNITAGITLTIETLMASAANLVGIPVIGTGGTIKLTDVTIAATVLTELNGLIAGTLNAEIVTTITGTATEISAVQSAAGLTKPAGWIAQLTAGPAAAIDLTAIDLNNTTTVDASLITTITGTAAEIAAVQSAAGITKPASWIAQPTAGTAAATDLTAIDLDNSTAVDASLYINYGDY